MTTMLLDGARSNTAIDQPRYVNVELSGKNKVFKKTKIDETMDLYTLYKNEKDTCNRYRFLFVVNPVCSNVLFNRKTEVVAYEGSDRCVTLSDFIGMTAIGSTCDQDKDGCERLLDNIKRGKNSASLNLKLYEAIKDTEFSHPDLGNLTYHCGADICNNHILRSKDFVFSNFITNKSQDLDKKVFNTIEDTVRTEQGVGEKDFVGTDISAKSVDARLYSVDSIMTFDESFKYNIYEKDGWLGFDNVSNINLENLEYDDGKKKISVNRVINNIGPCAFVDLYPDRTLFSAVPKYNNYRHRQEHNWDYCLTYPFKNDEEMLFKINGFGGKFEEIGNVGIAMTVERVIYSNSGEKAILFKTLVNHNLHVGRYITLTLQQYRNGARETRTITDRIQVVGVGTEKGFDKEKYFSVRESDMPSGIVLIKDEAGEYYYLSEGSKDSTKKVLFAYKQNVSNTNCKYYFRKFKKIKVSTTSAAPRYDVSKLAFGSNIYGDEMAQVIFNDDVVLDGLKDNLGRELSEIYLTIVKTNRGHAEWYKRSEIHREEDKNKRGENVEFSHCFGKVTSGVRMNSDNENYNVEKLHNINISAMKDPTSSLCIKKPYYPDLKDENGKEKYSAESKDYATGTEYVMGKMIPPKVIEDDITIDNDKFDELYGDIVEFNPIQFTETILAPVYYRFNTEQRECYYNEEYFNIYKDEIATDNFEVRIGAQNSNERRFRVDHDVLNVADTITGAACANDGTGDTEIKKYLMAGNLNPEGYYYNPHHKIVVKELSDELQEVEMDRINADINNTEENFIIYSKNRDGSNTYDIVRVVSPRDYGFKKGGTVVFYDRNTQDTYFGTIETVINRQTLIVKVVSTNEIADKSGGAITVSSYVMPDSVPGFEPDKSAIYKISNRVLIMFSNSTIPSYAVFRPSTSSYIWRPTINISDVTSSSSLFDVPFSNGALYIEKNINIFLKRQDPRGENYLYNYMDRPMSSTGSGDQGGGTTTISSFLRKIGMPKLDLRYLLEGDDNITFDLC